MERTIGQRSGAAPRNARGFFPFLAGITVVLLLEVFGRAAEGARNLSLQALFDCMQAVAAAAFARWTLCRVYGQREQQPRYVRRALVGIYVAMLVLITCAITTYLFIYAKQRHRPPARAAWTTAGFLPLPDKDK